MKSLILYLYIPLLTCGNTVVLPGLTKVFNFGSLVCMPVKYTHSYDLGLDIKLFQMIEMFYLLEMENVVSIKKPTIIGNATPKIRI